jgi:hypothetical protein
MPPDQPTRTDHSGFSPHKAAAPGVKKILRSRALYNNFNARSIHQLRSESVRFTADRLGCLSWKAPNDDAKGDECQRGTTLSLAFAVIRRAKAPRSRRAGACLQAAPRLRSVTSRERRRKCRRRWRKRIGASLRAPREGPHSTMHRSQNVGYPATVPHSFANCSAPRSESARMV